MTFVETNDPPQLPVLEEDLFGREGFVRRNNEVGSVLDEIILEQRSS